jgi:hypothetical protein
MSITDDVVAMRAELAAVPRSECDAFLAGWLAAVTVLSELADDTDGVVFIGPMIDALAETARLVNPHQ